MRGSREARTARCHGDQLPRRQDRRRSRRHRAWRLRFPVGVADLAKAAAERRSGSDHAHLLVDLRTRRADLGRGRRFRSCASTRRWPIEAVAHVAIASPCSRPWPQPARPTPALIRSGRSRAVLRRFAASSSRVPSRPSRLAIALPTTGSSRPRSSGCGRGRRRRAGAGVDGERRGSAAEVGTRARSLTSLRVRESLPVSSAALHATASQRASLPGLTAAAAAALACPRCLGGVRRSVTSTLTQPPAERAEDRLVLARAAGDADAARDRRR